VFSLWLFYKNIDHVLQTVIQHVLCSCLSCSLPLEDGSGGELSLVRLLGIVFDHLTRLAGDGRDLGIGTPRLEEEHDGGSPEAVDDAAALPEKVP
jgi:hypothetical protein